MMKRLLTHPLAVARTTMARSTAVSRLALRLRDQMNGVVVEHLGADIDMERNGEAWIVRQLAPGSRTFVDVGANVGDWTAAFLAAAPAARGWLIEASSSAASQLERRFAGDPRVSVHRAAASERSGTVTFYEEPDAGHTSSVIPGFSRKSAQPRTVQAITVDGLVAAERIEAIDFLKVDAEGHDLQVMRGAEGLLRAGRIGALQFEYNRPWQQVGSTLGAAFTFFGDLGYEVLLLKGPGLYRFPLDVYGEFFHYSNFVALPRQRMPSLNHLMRGDI